MRLAPLMTVLPLLGCTEGLEFQGEPLAEDGIALWEPSSLVEVAEIGEDGTLVVHEEQYIRDHALRLTLDEAQTCADRQALHELYDDAYRGLLENTASGTDAEALCAYMPTYIARLEADTPVSTTHLMMSWCNWNGRGCGSPESGGSYGAEGSLLTADLTGTETWNAETCQIEQRNVPPGAVHLLTGAVRTRPTDGDELNAFIETEQVEGRIRAARCEVTPTVPYFLF